MAHPEAYLDSTRRTRIFQKISIEAKAYDNCTAEGLGTIQLESGWKNAADLTSTIQEGIGEAVTNGFDPLLSTFTSYIGSWINNGTPYELRFYNCGTFRDFRELKGKLKDDKNFGGDLEIVNSDNYTKLNCTFKNKPDELADNVLDYSDGVPSFKSKNLDVKFIYGRQISFAPHDTKVPGLPNAPSTQSTDGANNPAGNGNTEVKPVNTNTGSTKPANLSSATPATTASKPVAAAKKAPTAPKAPLKKPAKKQ